MFDASNPLQLYWFSLPYSCKISDIFGLEGYNTKWVIQRYRGDKRGVGMAANHSHFLG